MGCDVSEKESGVVDAGRGAFINALGSFDKEYPDKLNPHSFAPKVLTFVCP